MKKRLCTFLLLATSQAYGAFTLIASGQSNWGAGGNIYLNTTGANLIVATISVWYTATTYTVGDFVGPNSNNACYTQAALEVNSGHLLTKTVYCLNPTYTGATHAFYSYGGNFTMFVAAYSGAATSAALDTVNALNAKTGSTTIQPGTITPTCSNELVIMGYATEYPAFVSLTGITDVIHHAQTDSSGWKGGGLGGAIQTGATAINPTLTVSGSPYNGGGMSASIVAFKAADSVCGNQVRVRHHVTGGE